MGRCDRSLRAHGRQTQDPPLPRSLASCKKPGQNGPWFIPQEGLPPLEVQRSRKKEPGGGAAHPFPGLWADKGFLLLTRPRACVPSARNAEPPRSATRQRGAHNARAGHPSNGPGTARLGEGRPAGGGQWRREGRPPRRLPPAPRGAPLQLQGRLRPGRLLTPSTPPAPNDPEERAKQKNPQLRTGQGVGTGEGA